MSSASTSARPRRTSIRVLDAASRSGAAPLFDEADALAGKRPEVKSAGDRYDSAAMKYLRRHIDTYTGIVSMT